MDNEHRHDTEGFAPHGQAPQGSAQGAGQGGVDPAAPYGRCLHCTSPLPPPVRSSGRRLKYCPAPRKCRQDYNNAARVRTVRDQAQLSRDAHVLSTGSAPVLDTLLEQLTGYRQAADALHGDLLARNQELEDQVAELTADNDGVRAQADADVRDAIGLADRAARRAEEAERAAAVAEARTARAQRARGIADGHRQSTEAAARRGLRGAARQVRDLQRLLESRDIELSAARRRSARLGQDLQAAHLLLRQAEQESAARWQQLAGERETERRRAAEREQALHATLRELTAALDAARRDLAAANARQQQALIQASAAIKAGRPAVQPPRPRPALLPGRRRSPR